MAKLEYLLHGGFDETVSAVERGILQGSISATLEESSDWREGEARCAVRIFERYSAFGGNRLSLSVTFFGGDGRIHVSASASGGSQAMFFKINTVGEEAFLDAARAVLDRLA